MNSRIITAFFCMALLSISCKEELSDYREYYNEAVCELSSESCYGRSVFGNGDINAARYIINEISSISDLLPDGDTATDHKFSRPPYKSKIRPWDEGRWAEVKGKGRYIPYLQNFSFPMNLMWGDMAVSVDGRALRAVDDFTAKEFSPSCHGEFDVVYMPDYAVDRNDFVRWFEGRDCKNSFVVVSWAAYKKLPAHPFERFIPYIGQLKNVGGIIFDDVEVFPYFKARSYYTTPMPVLMTKDFPREASRIKVDIDAEMMYNKDSHNILAWLPGTDPTDEHYYTFIAHYDHLDLMGRDNLYHGANDNASGAAMLMTLAKYFSKNRPKRSIQFIWLDAEESNLLGAFYYCDNPVRPLDKVKCVIDLDMIADNGDHLATESSDSGIEELGTFEKLNADGTYPPFNMVRQPFSDNSDHYAFGEYGVPAIYFSTEGDYLKDYHTPRDTSDNCSDDNFERLFNLIIRYINE